MTEAPRKTVLVLEDDEAVRSLVCQVLGVKGFKAVPVTTGVGALAALEAGGVDVVLADKNVPQLSGLELARQVRERWPHVAVVLMTAHPEAGTLNAAPIDGYLAKPFRGLDVIARSMESALERRARALEVEALQRRLSDVKGSLRASETPAPTVAPGGAGTSGREPG